MRVTSDLQVAALSRRIFSAGSFATVLRRGASEAGAIFIVWRGRDRMNSLYGPAAQSEYGEGRAQERRFAMLIEAASDEQVEQRMAKETRFDPDLWLVEIESDEPAASYLAIDD